MIIVKKITAKDTYEIRQEILRKGIDLPYMFDGDLDKETFHLGAFDENKLVAIATFMKSVNECFNSSQYQLRGMATIEIARGKGCGKMMITNAANYLKIKNVKVLWCNARVEALEFYTKIDFKVKGASFLVDKVGEHYAMYKELE